MASAGVKSPKVALFLTRGPGDIFYHLVEGVGHAAASDLGMTLEVHYAYGNHILMVEQVEKALQSTDKPDAVVFVNFKQRDRQIIELAEAAKVPVIVMNSGVTPDFDMGKPREKYQFWLGELLPDDYQAGYDLTKYLVENAERTMDGKVHLFGIEGEHYTGASIERTKGLLDAVAELDYVVLEQVVAGNWEPELAGHQYALAIRRYPEMSVVWAASDGMALGVVNSSARFGRKLPERIGSFDWTLEAIDAVREGRLDVSMGGHFMEAAWVLVLLHDYFKGLDFADVALSLRDPMYPMTKHNYVHVQELLKPSSWKKINFRAFSRYYNPEMAQYSFSVEQVMLQINEPIESKSTQK